MPTKSLKLVCSICHNEFNNLAEATKCEARGLYLPYFNIGDRVPTQTGGLSSAVIKDILFPVCFKSSHSDVISYHPLGHNYQVSYLFRSQYQEVDEGRYFDQDEILGIYSESVIRESEMFFKDGEDYISNHRERCTKVNNWNEFVTKVVKSNPGLADRMQRLSAFFQKEGMI